MEALRILVAIASYGVRNDAHLREMVRTYQAMPFDIDVVVVSNIAKSLGPDVECRVGLPDRNPWSLPFAHKRLFAERADDYDLYIYSEDDILISQRNLDAWREVNALLREDEVAGFLRVEHGPGGEVNFPDAHAWFHWDVSSVRRRGDFTLASFTNLHAAAYVLSRAQLARARASGGFDVPPHEGEYDLLCTAATDVYTQCGLTKLIPVSRLDDFTVHHMSNRYVGEMGVSGDAFARQARALLDLADETRPARSLLPATTALWRAHHSKDYYEPLHAEVVAAVPASARSALSLGCGAGATEIALRQRGLRVAALPLDPVIAAGAADAGVELIAGDLTGLNGRRFDVVLALNILHLLPDPAATLTQLNELLSDEGTILIQSPDMLNLPALWRQIRNRRWEIPLSFTASRAHWTSPARLRRWCAKAGLTFETTGATLHPRFASLGGALPSFLQGPLACEIFALARRSPSRRPARAPTTAPARC